MCGLVKTNPELLYEVSLAVTEGAEVEEQVGGEELFRALHSPSLSFVGITEIRFRFGQIRFVRILHDGDGAAATTMQKRLKSVSPQPVRERREIDFNILAVGTVIFLLVQSTGVLVTVFKIPIWSPV